MENCIVAWRVVLTIGLVVSSGWCGSGCDGGEVAEYEVAEPRFGGHGQAVTSSVTAHVRGVGSDDSEAPQEVEHGGEATRLPPDPAPRRRGSVETEDGEREASAGPEPSTPAPPEKPDADEQETASSSSSSRVAASVSFVSPGSMLVSNPVTMAVQTMGAIQRVEYWVDGNFQIGLGLTPSTGFASIYSFWMVGDRLLEARAFDGVGHLVAEASMIFTVPAPAPPESSPQPPPPEPSSGSGSGEDPTSPPETPSGCNPGELIDCVGNCADPDWVADGFCDDGSQYAIDFTCPELGMDGDDCGLQGQSPCADGKLLDCLGQCAKAEWIDDGICDDGTQYNIVLTCQELGMDGDDCASPGDANGGGAAPNPPPSSPATGGSVPYFYQYANSLYPGSSCQNTSVAMVLTHFGWGGTPDDITSAWGKNYAQSPAGLANVFNDYAQAMGIPQRLVAHTDGSIAGLQALLAQGKPTIIHGYMTTAGHVVVATGYNGSTYSVNDPAGKWSEGFQSGYPYGWNNTIGEGIAYDASAFEQAVSTLNGSTYAPLWYHEVTP